MRIYLPATAADLSAPEISPRLAHAATQALARALPEEDEEGLEVSASLCAADSSLVLLAEPGNEAVSSRRVVIAADVEHGDVRELEAGDEVLPGTVELLVPVTWENVAALFVDEPEAQADVAAARAGDEEAFERAAEADLLWFDASERRAVAADIS
ncbi:MULTISPECIES: DUF6912 family protein [Actinomyces]|uniref:Uncharacterized protein n=1 Tax=Actinomyces respiraculi TaxID=2744574 RepID=A0A7T0PWV9_9ACTO|nr:MULTISPECIES: hypothetical protein [Actinomyces]QPL05858.1 hypothetical protein ID810_02505 [Actinomyces respiraculi]